MKYCFFTLVFIATLTSSIYDYTINNIDGNAVSMSNYQNKKILLVNIATDSGNASQLSQLQQLQDQYSNTLIVIGFPSNSFGNESRDNASIKEFCQSQYGTSFLLAAKGSVKGGDIQPVYQWLTRETENGEFDNEVSGDFQKYIISENGQLVGIFKGSVSPLDNKIISVIISSFN